ncbi:MAG: RHS repeat-associated core domain-containing protein [Chloroflexota bacterium]
MRRAQFPTRPFSGRISPTPVNANWTTAWAPSWIIAKHPRAASWRAGQARFYSPALGRFLQPDTIIPNLASPQSFNRFSYVINNPIRYNDPTGHCFGPAVVICGEIIVGIAVLAVVELTIYYTINTPEGERLRNQAANAMSSAIDSVSEFAKQKQTKEEKARAELEANSRLTADDMFALLGDVRVRYATSFAFLGLSQQ